MHDATISSLKTLGYATITPLMVYLSIPQEQFMILSILMILDYVTGIMKQYSLNPQKITSNRGVRGMLKKVLTMIAVLSIALVMKALKINEVHYITSILSIFIVSEAYSILQNIYTYRTGIILKEFDVISLILRNFMGFFDKIIAKIWNEIPNDKDENIKK